MNEQIQTKGTIVQSSGRMQMILDSRGPLILVVPNDQRSEAFEVALRLAHDLDMFHRLDSQIWTSDDAMRSAKAGRLGHGNIIVIGSTSMSFVQWLLGLRMSSFRLDAGYMKLQNLVLNKPSTGMGDPIRAPLKLFMDCK